MSLEIHLGLCFLIGNGVSMVSVLDCMKKGRW